MCVYAQTAIPTGGNDVVPSAPGTVCRLGGDRADRDEGKIPAAAAAAAVYHLAKG